MNDLTPARMGLTLTHNDAARAATIAEAVGVSKAGAVKLALEVAAEVFQLEDARKFRRGSDALAAYCQARGAERSAPPAEE